MNEANTKWLWGIVRKNIEEEEITYETINEKVKELYGEELNIKYPKEGMEFIKYNEETNDYIPSEIELDANDDRFYINKITKIKMVIQLKLLNIWWIIQILITIIYI